MNKINFYCIGAQKAGTTTLHDILSQHSQVYLPNNKEAHFFDNEERYTNGLNWYYHEFFKDIKNEKVIGSFTPEYLFFPNVAQRIFENLGGDIKFIVILRNPVDRAISQYKMSWYRGYENKSFNYAIYNEDSRIEVNSWNLNHYSYLSRGFYYKQLCNYLTYYPIENFKFFVFENDIEVNIDRTIQEMQIFLGIDQEYLDISIKSNPALVPKLHLVNNLFFGRNSLKKLYNIPGNQKFKSKLKRYILKRNTSIKKSKDVIISDFQKNELLKEFFLNDIEKLEKLIGLDLSVWYQK